MQNFPKNLYFLLPDTHTYLCVSAGEGGGWGGGVAGRRGRGGKEYKISFPENFKYVLNK